jgi:hypothetical protein
MADIELPNGGKAPMWATEETMRSLLSAVKGASAFSGKGGSSGGTDDEEDTRKKLNDQTKDYVKNILKLNNKDEGVLRLLDSTKKIGVSFGKDGLQGGLGLASEGLLKAAESAGKFAPVVTMAAYALSAYADLMGKYLKTLPAAIEAGLGFSSSLGESARIADRAGVSVEAFYKAIDATGATYRALGDNAYEAARNFGELQGNIRTTFGTFGQSNEDMAASTGAYVKLMAQTGLRGSAAMDQASSTYGNSMEQMRKISIATGTSFKSLQTNMKDLLANPVVIAGMNKLGKSTEDAVISMSKASAGFEAVFGKLGVDLYKQMVEAEAAGLSIINTELGAALAPFTDLGAMTKFNKMLNEGGATATEMAEAQRQFLAGTEANLPTLRLLAQQGDQAAKQMLELYNKAKSMTVMSQDQLDAQELKNRAEERLLNIQNKLSAAYQNVVNKLFGFLDAIPTQVFETIGTVLEGVGTVAGYLIDGLVGISKVLGPVIAVLGGVFFAVKGVVAAFALLTNPIGWAVAAITAIGVAIQHWDDIVGYASQAWDASLSYVTGIFRAAGDLLSAAGDKIVAAFEYIGSGVTKVGDFFKSMFDGLTNWFKSSWLGKKIFGDSASTADSSSPVMDSKPAGSSKVVQDAAAAVVQAKAETERTANDKSTEHLERLARIAQESAEQQANIAKNTANTASAVENSSTSY